MMVIPDVEDMRRAWKTAQANLLKAQIDIQSLTMPDWFEHPECCDAPELRYITDGMVSSHEVEMVVEERLCCARTDGWDDMSDDGYDSWLECINCEAVWQAPENTEFS